MMTRDKPRLRLRGFQFADKVVWLWGCQANGRCVGYGKTPSDAYADWLSWRAFRIAKGLSL